MDYQGFKDHLIVFLWKSGDTQLINSLDNLILMANSELDRKLKIEDRHESATVTANALSVALPADYGKMRSVNLPTGEELTYVKPSKIRHMQQVDQTFLHYSLIRSNLLLAGDYVADPLDLTVDYYTKIPDFAVEDASWVADDYLDLYTYTTLKHSAPFLREDTRIAVWQGMAVDALESALEDSAFNRERGSPSSMPLPRQAGVIRRR